MAERSEYAVIRFVDQNGYCHMVSDYVKGYSLMQYVKMDIPVAKKCLIHWMAELAHQLEQYSKCEEEKAYGFVNPYAVIVTEDERLLLLDAADQESEELVKRMRKKKVRALFVRKHHMLSQRMERADDFYGFAKTILFMMDQFRLDETFTRREERALRKIVGRCMEGQSTGRGIWKEIQRELGRLEQDEGKKVLDHKGLRKLSIVAALVIAVAAGAVFGKKGRPIPQTVIQAKRNEVEDEKEDRKEESVEQEERTEEAEIKTEEEDAAKNVESLMELGLIHFVDWQDYEKSCEYLESAAKKSEQAGNYLTIARNLQSGGTENLIRREIERAVKDIRQKQGKEESVLYQIPLLYGYELLGTKDARQEIIEMGEVLHEQYQWSEKEWNRERQIEQCLARAYERVGETERAIQIYGRIKELERETEEKEKVYLRMEALYEKNGDSDKAWEICEEAVKSFPKSERVQVHYLRYQLADKKTKREDCAKTIKKFVKSCPNLLENEEFKALQEEYEIIISGEAVTVEK